MPDATERRRASLAVWTGVTVLLMIAYLASVGPFLGAYWRGFLPEGSKDVAFDTVYLPIKWVDYNTEFFREHPIGKVYYDYVFLWSPG